MPAENDALDIVVCLGSSCFARGNAENLAILKEYAASHRDKLSLHLTGCLCQDRCGQSPNLKVNGKFMHGVNAEALRALLDQLEKPERRSDGTV
jgi:NADH:ubiquinone oxidoreductase subunit E